MQLGERETDRRTVSVCVCVMKKPWRMVANLYRHKTRRRDFDFASARLCCLAERPFVLLSGRDVVYDAETVMCNERMCRPTSVRVRRAG